MNQKPKVSVSDGAAVIDNKVIKLRNILLEKPIDSGAHGSVFAGIETSLERKIAAKIWYKVGDKIRDGAIGEVRKLAALTHPLFVTVYQLDEVDETPYSIMEIVNGITLKKWIKENGLNQVADGEIRKHLIVNKHNLSQRCKFWSLYSSGLRYIYANGMLHGDPHLGNVIAVRDEIGSSDRFVRHSVVGSKELLSIKILDLGTSLFRVDQDQMLRREVDIIKESANKLFKDININRLMVLDLKLDPIKTLDVIDKILEYIIEITSMPGMSKTGFDFISHSMPQLLGWCPFFNYELVNIHLSSLLLPNDVQEIMSYSLWQMQTKNQDVSYAESLRLLNEAKNDAPNNIKNIQKTSETFRRADWKYEPDSRGLPRI